MKKNNIAKVFIAGALAMSVALAGCVGQGQGKGVDNMLDDTTMTIEGGWAIPENPQNILSDDEAAIFADVMEGFTGVGYEPFAVVATQLVSGTNRAYLCKGTLVTPEGGTSWYIVTVYTNLSGESEILSIKELDVDNPLILDESAGDLVGAWTAVKPEAAVLSGDEAEAFATATKDLLGVSYTPIAVLGANPDGSTSYLMLCYGETVTAEPESGLYLLQVYVGGTPGIDVSGTKSAQLDLNSYI